MSQTISLRATGRVLTALLVLLYTMSGCKVQLVPEYSETLETKVISSAMMSQKLYLEMLEVPESERNYGTFGPKYLEIQTEISSIELEVEGLRANSEFLNMVQNLDQTIEKYKAEHKRKGTLKDAEIEVYRAQIKALWKPLYKAIKSTKQ